MIDDLEHRSRYVPFVRQVWFQTIIGFVLLVTSVILAGQFFGVRRMRIVISFQFFEPRFNRIDLFEVYVPAEGLLLTF